jgi:hypothetical protein
MVDKDPIEPHTNEQLQNIIDGVAEIKAIVGVPIEKPGERRADASLPEGFVLSEQNEQAIRTIAAEKLGIGITTDITLETINLDPEGIAIVEGGQGHKMRTELKVALDSAHTGPIVITSTEYRIIKQTEDDPKVRERVNTAQLLGITEAEVGSTELAVAIQVVESLPGIEIAPEGNDVEELVMLGTVNGRPIYVYSIPRIYYETEDGETKYRQQSTYNQVHYIQDVLDIEDAALITSGTYVSSRVTAAKGSYKVAAYCPSTLAEVRGQDPATAKPSIEQILAEVAKIDIELARL